MILETCYLDVEDIAAACFWQNSQDRLCKKVPVGTDGADIVHVPLMHRLFGDGEVKATVALGTMMPHFKNGLHQTWLFKRGFHYKRSTSKQ